ncbi:MAG: glycosyltransferase [Paracoccus sp. (in: a-proteobacteria)]|nr:glycosyltransferase [Paracoccus sp. (in: a-proteobacteria)]
MKILLVHQNFPGQFLHLAPALAARGHEVLGLTDDKNKKPAPVQVARYATPPKVEISPRLGKFNADMLERAYLVARGARALRDRHGYVPDLIFGHPGWGETLMLREIWPEAKLLLYAELYYRSRGHDVGFDPEFDTDPDGARFSSVARMGPMAVAMLQADAALSPTRYQAESYPAELQDKITVIHDGIDTDRLRPDPAARVTLPDGTQIAAGDEVLTYIGRGLEPYRGFHVFMRALPEVLRARPNARVVIVGRNITSYGFPPRDAPDWKTKLLAELDGQLDLSRIHFTGPLSYADYTRVIQAGRVHCYLTYPFVLSWSLTEAMAMGANIVASDTEPVREFITDGVEGCLVPFFDRAALEAALIRGLEGDPDAPSRGQAARARIAGGYDLHRHSLPRLIDWVESHGPA